MIIMRSRRFDIFFGNFKKFSFNVKPLNDLVAFEKW